MNPDQKEIEDIETKDLIATVESYGTKEFRFCDFTNSIPSLRDYRDQQIKILEDSGLTTKQREALVKLVNFYEEVLHRQRLLIEKKMDMKKINEYLTHSNHLVRSIAAEVYRKHKEKAALEAEAVSSEANQA